jgi:RimJ/RimL family protein N-acetyltransferase
VQILNHPEFIYFPIKPKSIEEERDFLKKNRQKRKDGTEYNFSILCGGNLVGAVGLKVDQHRKHIGEIGYFVDRSHWGQGITPAAVRLH